MKQPPASLPQAQLALKAARKKFRQLKHEIASLMAFIAAKGGDPSGRPDQGKRNAQIVRLRKGGKSAREIALQYRLSTDRVRAICAGGVKKQKKAGVKGRF